jgi:hypothetical protein
MHRRQGRKETNVDMSQHKSHQSQSLSPNHVPLTVTVHGETPEPLLLNPFPARLSKESGVDLSSMDGAITDANTSSSDTVGGSRDSAELGRTLTIIILEQVLQPSACEISTGVSMSTHSVRLIIAIDPSFLGGVWSLDAAAVRVVVDATVALCRDSAGLLDECIDSTRVMGTLERKGYTPSEFDDELWTHCRWKLTPKILPLVNTCVAIGDCSFGWLRPRVQVM